ncbi:MAG TPA: gamma-glutamyl-gamma-aminobutyrate hydrolase family protein [Solirubrobacteraceae bacterium]|jgi:putative glutamine amidotransferase|nr:gamma-glutamyl-gamma-aminobutyrate hydrolase family protein [Solirubrobacteraceae bacterium]
MRRPIIGICTYLDEIQWGVWRDRAALVPAGYVAAVQRAGGVAVLLPPDREATEDPDPVLDLLDGLILAGGVDVAPDLYGANAHPATDVPNEERDAFELALARRALERDVPLLGICRGMQVMNVAAGGTLHQHLPEVVGHDGHRPTPGAFHDHDVRLQEGSLAARAAGEVVHAAKSHHHQGLEAVGEGFVVTGWSAVDDVPEAIERPERRFALGVQWHPEADETSRLIAALVEEARNGV